MNMKTVLILFFLVFIGFGYLLSDNLNTQQELEAAQQEQLQASLEIRNINEEKDALEHALANVQSENERLNLEIRLRSLEADRLLLEKQLAERGVDKLPLSGRVLFSGYVAYRHINLGRVVLTFPQTINLGDSEAVILTIIPNGVVYETPVWQIREEKPDASTLDLPDEIEISPIMTAKISGVGFEIVENVKQQVIDPDKPTEWVWTVQGKQEGRHILVTNIAVPIWANGEQEEVSADVHLHTVEIEVAKPLRSQFNSLLPYVLPAVTTGIVSFLVGLFVNVKRQNEDGATGASQPTDQGKGTATRKKPKNKA